MNWVSGLPSAGQFCAALGLFLNEPIVMSDLVKWEPVCRQLHYVYHAKLDTKDDASRAAAAEITKAIDDALAKMELDVGTDSLFSATGPTGEQERGENQGETQTTRKEDGDDAAGA